MRCRTAALIHPVTAHRQRRTHDQTYWGTGNPGPWMGDVRPGDNLYTNCNTGDGLLSPSRAERIGKRRGPRCQPPWRTWMSPVMPWTWLLSGVPRSGTSLCCRLAGDLPDTVLQPRGLRTGGGQDPTWTMKHRKQPGGTPEVNRSADHCRPARRRDGPLGKIIRKVFPRFGTQESSDRGEAGLVDRDQARTVWFYRDYVRLTGGHLKALPLLRSRAADAGLRAEDHVQRGAFELPAPCGGGLLSARARSHGFGLPRGDPGLHRQPRIPPSTTVWLPSRAPSPCSG